MKRVIVLGLLGLLLGFSVSAYGQDPHVQRGYIGIGASYAVENFDVDPIFVEGSVLDLDFDDSLGLKLKLGYRANEIFALEFAFDYLFEFDSTESVFISGIPVSADTELKIATFMASAKLSPDLGFETARLFILAGAGYMRAELDVTAKAARVSFSDSESESDPCLEFGAGAEFYVNSNVSISLEGSYVIGLNDLDNVRYFNSTLGVAYHF